MGWPLVKISASGPMPTSRYWLQAPALISVSFKAAASGEPGFSLRKSSPTRSRIWERIEWTPLASPRAFPRSASSRERRSEACRFEALQINWREKPRLALLRVSARRLDRISEILRRDVSLEARTAAEVLRRKDRDGGGTGVTSQGFSSPARQCRANSADITATRQDLQESGNLSLSVGAAASVYQQMAIMTTPKNVWRKTSAGHLKPRSQRKAAVELPTGLIAGSVIMENKATVPM